MGNALVRKERVGGDDKQVLHVPVSSSTQNPSQETPWPLGRSVQVLEVGGQGALVALLQV